MLQVPPTKLYPEILTQNGDICATFYLKVAVDLARTTFLKVHPFDCSCDWNRWL